MRSLYRSERLKSCLASCFVFNAGLSIATEHRFRHVSFEVSKEGALPRRQASEIQPLMAGPYTETYILIPGLTTDSVTIKTLTQPPLTTAITIPVYFCSEANCTATVDGALTQFNAEIQWPATITASTGVMSPPPWATQTLSVGCDGSIYTYGAPGPTVCRSANTASSSPNSTSSSAGTGSRSFTSTDSGNVSLTTGGGSATASSGGASGSDTATIIGGTPSDASGSSSTMSPTSGGASGTGAGITSNVSRSSENSASDTGAGTISTASGASSVPNSAAQSQMTGLPAASSGSTNLVTGSNIASPPGGSLSSNSVSESSANISPTAGSSTSTAGNGITSVVSPPPGSLSTSGSVIQSSVNSTVANNSPTSISGLGLSVSLYSVLTGSTAGSLMASGSASTASSPPGLTTSSNGGGGGHQPTTITSAPSSISTTFVFGSSVEPAVSSATAAIDDATDQINQLQNNQNDQNLKQIVLNLINQANTVAHTGGVGWLFGILGTAASEAEAVVEGTAPVADLINAWENVEKAESEYSSSSSESSESSSQSERSQSSETTQSGTTTSANPSSSNPRTVSSTTMSSSSMSSSSSASSSVSSCASGCTLSKVTLADVAVDPSMSDNLAAISSVELMALSWDNPSGWGVMGDASETGASSSMPSSTGSATTFITSATASIASRTTGGATSASSSGRSQITVAPSDFMADGAPWFNPTSWCDYGASGAKYPILTPSSGTLNCDYSTLPASTINPVSTTAAPTNIPGMNGVPGCNMELAGDQQACPGVDACNCGGTYVPVLMATVGGSVTSNCDYTIQPTVNSCPMNTALVASSVSARAATSHPAPPPTPTVGSLVCNPESETDGCKTSDVHADSVDATADYMGEQYSPSTFNSASANFTRTYREGGAGGKGVTYMMSIGWIPGCTQFASQRPDRPIDSRVEFNWQGLLKDTYYNCTGNAGLGGYVDVGCLRYGFFPNKVDGVFGADGPANPSLFWKTMHYC